MADNLRQEARAALQGAVRRLRTIIDTEDEPGNKFRTSEFLRACQLLERTQEVDPRVFDLLGKMTEAAAASAQARIAEEAEDEAAGSFTVDDVLRVVMAVMDSVEGETVENPDHPTPREFAKMHRIWETAAEALRGVGIPFGDESDDDPLDVEAEAPEDGYEEEAAEDPEEDSEAAA